MNTETAIDNNSPRVPTVGEPTGQSGIISYDGPCSDKDRVHLIAQAVNIGP
jgi:hypothetical protein